MSGYFLFGVREIKHADKAAEYRAQVFDTVEAFNGNYRILGGQLDRVEGDCAPGILVLIEFPNRDQGQNWYKSDIYRSLKNQRLEAMDAPALLVEGFDHQKST